MNEVALELVDDALAACKKTEYALLDSWFISPEMLAALLKHDLFGMEGTKKVYFCYHNRQTNMKNLYELL